MTGFDLQRRLQEVVQETLPAPGLGGTAKRHARLFVVGREDLTLAKLAEAHWDAVAILAEAGREPTQGALYAVWASEIPGQALRLERTQDRCVVTGTKPFCSGLGVVDRALITVGEPVSSLLEVALTADKARISYDISVWHTAAFAETRTGSITFDHAEFTADAIVGPPGWYVERPGFWHGACGPAACWAGGVAGLFDFATASRRKDPHTLAHLGALEANVWAMEALLERAGQEIDATPHDRNAALVRALQLRHLIEFLGTDCLRRFARAYGPQPLSMNADVARRYAEADLYIRQSHAERDLETLGRTVASPSA